jgi:hypothetical protein
LRRSAICLALFLSIAPLARADDAGTSSDGGAAAAKAEPDPCAAERARLERRKAWLLERHQEQASRGFPDPKAGIPDMVAVYCEANPTHEECRLGPPPIEFSPDELTWEAQQTFEDRDPHVIAMKRALDACRKRKR